MKITTSDYERLKTTITDYINQKTPELLLKHKQFLETLPNVKNIETRFIWDIYWAIPDDFRKVWNGDVHEYCNDDHIHTALRKAVKSAMGSLYPFGE